MPTKSQSNIDTVSIDSIGNVASISKDLKKSRLFSLLKKYNDVNDYDFDDD